MLLAIESAVASLRTHRTVLMQQPSPAWGPRALNGSTTEAADTGSCRQLQVRMFGGECDLFYGPGSEGEAEDWD